MSAKSFNIFIMIFFIIILPSCRFADWANQTFYQGCKIKTCLSIPREHIRSVRVYDQFTTLGIFNAMWLSDAVLNEFANLYAEKNALNDEMRCNFLERIKSDFGGYLSFYVLGYDPKEIDGPLIGKGKEPSWRIFLKINKVAYDPVVVKEINLNEEFKLFFGKTFTRFKKVYLVQFDAHADDDSLLVDPSTNSIVLCFHSLKSKSSMVWRINSEGKVVVDYDTYGDCCCMHEPDQVCEICDCIKKE